MEPLHTRKGSGNFEASSALGDYTHAQPSHRDLKVKSSLEPIPINKMNNAWEYKDKFQNSARGDSNRYDYKSEDSKAVVEGTIDNGGQDLDEEEEEQDANNEFN